MNQPVVTIIGGGLAGSAAAITLARAGASVVLLEREVSPVHKVCGEFLSEEAMELLHALGINPAILQAPSIRRLRLSHGQSTFRVDLPFRAQSLTRRELDEALLQQAERDGATVLRGAHAVSVGKTATGWTVCVRHQADLHCEHVVAATGKHDIAGLPRGLGKQNDLIGMKMYFRLTALQQRELREAIELHLFDGGYAGLQLVEDGTANLCCATDASRLASGPQRWPGLLEHMQRASPQLRTRLAGADALLEKPLAIAPVPYGLVQSRTQQRLWLVGDQAAVIPSFTGDGMSMALHSGVLAATALLSGTDACAFQQRYAHSVARQVRLATLLSRGMVHPVLQRCMTQAIHIQPSLLRWVAKQTRLPRSVRSECLETLAATEKRLS